MTDSPAEKKVLDLLYQRAWKYADLCEAISTDISSGEATRILCKLEAQGVAERSGAWWKLTSNGAATVNGAPQRGVKEPPTERNAAKVDPVDDIPPPTIKEIIGALRRHRERIDAAIATLEKIE